MGIRTGLRKTDSAREKSSFDEQIIPKRYVILTKATRTEMQDAVDIMMEQGWQPQGGVTFSSKVFFQAMVKEVGGTIKA